MSNQQNNWEWSLPEPISSILKQYVHQCQHPGLLLDKYTPYGSYRSGWQLGPRRDSKRVWLNQIVNTPSDKELAIFQEKRWLEIVKVHQFDAQSLDWRMETIAPLIVGLGAEHALETAITLDRNSGLPIIPGSALKGLARYSALIDIAKKLPFDQLSRKLEQLNALDNWLEQEKLDWKAIKRITGLEENPEASEITAYREIFGTVKKVGSIIFVEGIPLLGKGPYFRLDVMTPHFGDYYTHNKPPSEDQSPIPVTYLTLNSGQIFRFALLPRTQNDTRWVQQARTWLQTGLIDYGIGAKTAQGYGLFRNLEGVTS